MAPTGAEREKRIKARRMNPREVEADEERRVDKANAVGALWSMMAMNTIEDKVDSPPPDDEEETEEAPRDIPSAKE